MRIPIIILVSLTISFSYSQMAFGEPLQSKKKSPREVARGKPIKWYDEVSNDDYTWIGLGRQPYQEQVNQHYQESLKAMSGFREDALGETLAPDHPLTRHLQHLVDLVDQNARQLFLAETGEVIKAPPPLARIVVSKNLFNAYVTAVPVCSGMTFGNKPKDGVAVYLTARQISEKLLFNTTKQSMTCLPRPFTWNEEGLLNFWQRGSSLNPSCILKIESGPDQKKYWNVFPSPDCHGSMKNSTEISGVETILKSTSQFIHFSSDLIAKLNDYRTLWYVVSHELGHYYLGHATEKGVLRYNYWYLRANHKYGRPKRKVQADKNQIYLEEAYLYQEAKAKGRAIPDLDDKKADFSDRLNLFFIKALGGILRKFQSYENPNWNPICQNAVNAIPLNYQLQEDATDYPELTEVFLENEDLAKRLGSRDWITPILEEKATAEDWNDFSNFKKNFSLCANSLTIGTSKAPINSSQLMALMIKYIPGFNGTRNQGLHALTTMADALQLADREAKKIDRMVRRLLPTAKQNTLGFYTTEQAADEFALKVATMGGLSTDDVLEGVFGFVRAKEISLGPTKTERLRNANLELDFSACYRAYQDSKSSGGAKGFSLEREGEFISLGKLSDQHHSDCYRIFNLWRLIQIDQQIAAAARGDITDKKMLVKLPVERFFSSDHSELFKAQHLLLMSEWQKMRDLAIQMSR